VTPLWDLLLGDLKTELQKVLNNIQNGGEYQINDGIKAMMVMVKSLKPVALMNGWTVR
jgi:hypothetical protein